MLIINSPQRPNGMIVGQLDEIAAICAEHDVIVLTDVIFSHMVYAGAEHKTIAAVEGMADRSSCRHVLEDLHHDGVPDRLVRGQQGDHRHDGHLSAELASPNVPAFVQLAATGCHHRLQEHVEQTTARLQAKRDNMVAGLNAMPGIECPTRTARSTCSPTSAAPA